MVSLLFCDLVGFTAALRRARIRRMSIGCWRRISTVGRAQIEAHGGMVEKFIGDAVVGVFGVPVTHEDDPERAVRAGLRIAEDAEGLLGYRRCAARGCAWGSTPGRRSSGSMWPPPRVRGS